MITAQHQSLLEQSDALYEHYGKPLEKTHRGKYLAISQDGKTLTSCLSDMRSDRVELQALTL
jgi:hypothetical protein